jgi:imidazolonepropionase-like amidohydrolase
MAANGQTLVPTLSFLIGLAEERSATWSPLLVELGKHNVEQAQLTLVAAREGGVMLAMGYDSSPLRTATNELLALVDFGLTAGEALAAATTGSAYALGLDDQIGTIEPGKIADLLVVDGDPLTEPALLCDRARIWLVLRIGSPVAGAALETSL